MRVWHFHPFLIIFIVFGFFFRQSCKSNQGFLIVIRRLRHTKKPPSRVERRKQFSKADNVMQAREVLYQQLSAVNVSRLAVHKHVGAAVEEEEMMYIGIEREWAGDRASERKRERKEERIARKIVRWTAKLDNVRTLRSTCLQLKSFTAIASWRRSSLFASLNYIDSSLKLFSLYKSFAFVYWWFSASALCVCSSANEQVATSFSPSSSVLSFGWRREGIKSSSARSINEQRARVS